MLSCAQVTGSIGKAVVGGMVISKCLDLITDNNWGLGAGAGGLGSRHIDLREKKKRHLLYFHTFQISGFQNSSKSGTFLTKEILPSIAKKRNNIYNLSLSI